MIRYYLLMVFCKLDIPARRFMYQQDLHLLPYQGSLWNSSQATSVTALSYYLIACIMMYRDRVLQGTEDDKTPCYYQEDL